MYIAITSKSNVLEIASNEAASLEGMNVYSSLGYPSLKRIPANGKAFVKYSKGKKLTLDIKVTNGKIKTIILS